ncbi:MAG: tRNA (adenosine(37)-N6)-threonylcarbamoyltransferase complex ATPase subunit type 1 TsaE [Ruminococcus sp.]|nr:tRNA (adenosine(37)-N6)-threonylcarbamoyltransferase complex ATPase subunit type 1 TsaE [Ruminococcus sp.]
MTEIITHSPEETIAAAEKLAKCLRPGDMIAFRGGLGAGKTTFTRGLALGLGLGDCVSSPTFALVNEYRDVKGSGSLTLYHFDMYRITTEEGLESTGFFDYDFDNNIAVIEWSENIEEFLPEDTIYITIGAAGEGDAPERKITIKDGERFADAWD